MAHRELVKGQAKVDDLVTYEDMANPRQTFQVVAVYSEPHQREFELLDIETGERTFSDLRQCGWTR